MRRILTTAPTTSPNPTDVLWVADAEKAMSLEWAGGGAADINGGQGTSLTSPLWNPNTTRILQVTNPVAKGQRAYKLTTFAGDRDIYSDGAQRSSLGQNNPTRTFDDGTGDRQMRQGEERWIAFQFRLPSGFPSGEWVELMQNKCTGRGSGPLYIGWWGGYMLCQKSQTQTFGSEDLGIVWYATIPYDTWIKVLWHVKWSVNSDGFYELFGDIADGQGYRQLVSRQDGWTLKYHSDGNPTLIGAAIGMYRSIASQDSTVYFDGMTVARTRAAAEASAF